MRLSDEFIAKVDAWAEKQDDHPGRQEARRAQWASDQRG
jgi:hypothetical protein